jgi:histone demethylase JARID1
LPAFEAAARAEVAALFPDLPEGATPAAGEVERLYWETVGRGNRRLFAHDGNDLSVLEANRRSLRRTHNYRSLFPTTRRNPASHHQFNLNVLPRAPGSLLAHLPTRIAGVTDPMVYVGSALSTFAWHAEDNLLCSANFLHHGASKLWYGVPCASHEAFEQVFRRTTASLDGGPGLIHDLVTQLSPATLLAAGVPVCTTIQEEGEYVITFSGAFHSGFNLGFNVAEAVNFAPPSWLPLGRVSVAKYHGREGESRESVFSYENAVHAAALAFVQRIETVDRPVADVRSLVKLGQRVAVELEAMVRGEAAVRARLRHEGVVHVSAVPAYAGRDAEAEDDMIQCCVCRRDAFLSAVVCPCTLARLACPAHHGSLCPCPPSAKRHLIRYSQEYLEGLLGKMKESLRSLVSVLNAL